MGTGGTATLNASTGALTLNAAATADNAAIVCTFTNALTSDLSITKTDNVTNVAGSQALVYTVVTTNNGPSTATSALLKDALPTGLASFSSITCAVASGTATCPATMTQALITGAGITIPSMAANSSLKFLISGTTTATLLANIVNTATVTPSSVMVNSGTSCDRRRYSLRGRASARRPIPTCPSNLIFRSRRPTALGPTCWELR